MVTVAGVAKEDVGDCSTETSVLGVSEVAELFEVAASRRYFSLLTILLDRDNAELLLAMDSKASSIIEVNLKKKRAWIC